MLRFAHWNTTPAITGLETTEEFIVDIPEGTSRESVIAKLAIECGASDQPGDGYDFESEWPREIKNEFESLDSNSKIIWRWSDL
jgi:hypothetical protein